jgi:Ulp1 family protease catalytic subunit
MGTLLCNHNMNAFVFVASFHANPCCSSYLSNTTDAIKLVNIHRRLRVDFRRNTRFLVPVHVAADPGHWVAAEFDTLKQSVIVSDSLPQYSPRKRAESIQNAGYELIKAIQTEGGFCESRDWEMVLNPGRLQSASGNSCGFYAAAAITAAARGLTGYGHLSEPMLRAAFVFSVEFGVLLL